MYEGNGKTNKTIGVYFVNSVWYTQVGKCHTTHVNLIIWSQLLVFNYILVDVIKNESCPTNGRLLIGLTWHIFL